MTSKAEHTKDEEQNIRVETYVFDETQRAQEGRAKLIVLLIIGLLVAGYGTWNIWRMVEAVNSPVISAKTSQRSQLAVPGLVLCGVNINQAVQCYKSAFNAADDDYTKGIPCDEYLSTTRIDGIPFVNMRGFYNQTGMFCYIFSPTQPLDNSGTKPLVFDNDTQKIALALYSTDLANNTLGAITNDQWFFFGVFNEHEDPRFTKFQIVKIPSISYLYFSRTEEVQTLSADAITGGFTGDGSLDPSATVEIDTSFTSFAISGFAISPNLWGLFRIIPRNYLNDTKRNTQVYPVEVLYNRVEFTLLQLAANMGGFVSILSAIYFLLLGSRRVDPWGLVQRYILKSVPPPPPAYAPTVMPYTDVKAETGSQYGGYSASNSSGTPQQPNAEILPYRQGYPVPGYPDDHGMLLNDPSRVGTQQQQPSYIQPTRVNAPNPSEIPDDFNNDPRYLRLRQELRAEVQLTIAREVGRLRQFLSKYYLKDVVKTE